MTCLYACNGHEQRVGARAMGQVKHDMLPHKCALVGAACHSPATSLTAAT